MRSLIWKVAAVGIVSAIGVASLTAAEAPRTELSGVYRDGDALLVVSDNDAATYYRIPLSSESGRISIDMTKAAAVSIPDGATASDLESIGRLADGRLVVLSEDARALYDEEGRLVAEYPADVAEDGGRGLEGLAVRAEEKRSSQIAVLWEGGYPQTSTAVNQEVQPVVLLHSLAKKARHKSLALSDVTRLVLPTPPTRGRMGYRATDLVWHTASGASEPELIVLLVAEVSWGTAPCPCSILQRYSLQGTLIGEPFELNSVIPVALQRKNWEGLGWFVEGESLVAVYDEEGVTTTDAVVIPLPADWRTPGARD